MIWLIKIVGKLKRKTSLKLTTEPKKPIWKKSTLKEIFSSLTYHLSTKLASSIETLKFPIKDGA